jgi:Tfp pilus assembly protein PilP
MALALAYAFVAACGGDDEAPPAAVRPGAAAPAAPGGGVGSAKDDKNKLVPRRRVEEKVGCPVADKERDPKDRYDAFKKRVDDDDAAYKQRYGVACTPEGAPCDKGYCLDWENAKHCIRCAERDRIRHDFVDRDFSADQNRDPFQSFVVAQPGLGGGVGSAAPIQPTPDCKNKDQLVATNYSFADLRLVGIVAQGTVHKALLMDSVNVGHIVKLHDCVGKEKAVVVDIAAGNYPYIKFVVHPEQAPQGTTTRPDQERSMELHPKLEDLSPTYNQEEMPPQPPTPAVTPKKDTTKPPPEPPPVRPVTPEPQKPVEPVEPPEHPRR